MNVWMDVSEPERPAPAVRPNWALAPMLAGARARGFADGLEWLGLAAALIDERGETLHLNAGAIELLGDDIFIEGGRLRSHDPDLDAAISDSILETLMTGQQTEFTFDNGRALNVRVVALDGAAEDECQLMRAVAVFERVGSA